jgi:small-conductance mechanosensitive channel
VLEAFEVKRVNSIQLRLSLVGSGPVLNQEPVAVLLAEPAPVVLFVPGFGASSLDFTLIVHVRDVADQQPVQHELNKRIFKRFRQEGIEIPFPTRTIYVKEPAPEKIMK